MLRMEAEKRQGPPGTPEEWFGKSLPLQHTHILARPHRDCRPPQTERPEPCVPIDPEEFSFRHRAESTVSRPARSVPKAACLEADLRLNHGRFFPKPGHAQDRSGADLPQGLARLDPAIFGLRCIRVRSDQYHPLGLPPD